MNKPVDVSEAVAQSLAAMENLSRVRPRADFQQRVLERLAYERRSAGARRLSWAAIGLLLLLNTAAAYQRLSVSGARAQLKSALSARYGLQELTELYRASN
ncbi:MAG: hypothetical protein ACR2K1_07440 [Saprospiraceae bacterium]